MRRLLSLLLLAPLVHVAADTARAQDSGTIFYDRNWRETVEDSSFYRRTFERVDDSLFAIEDYFRWGALAMQGTMAGYRPGALRVGPFRYFHQSGALRETVTFEAGEEEGEVTRFYPSGKIEMRGQYGGGRRVGTFSRWYSDGNLESEGAYRNDEKHGPWTYWHANGEVRAKGSYDRDLETGRWEWFYESGELEGVGEHDPITTKGERTWYDRDGRISGREKVYEGKVVEAVYIDANGVESTDWKAAYRKPLPEGVESEEQLPAYFASRAMYPEIARRDGVEGVVVLFLLIDHRGEVVESRVEFSSNQIFIAAAEEMARRAEWRPGLRHGVPAMDGITVPFRFEL